MVFEPGQGKINAMRWLKWFISDSKEMDGLETDEDSGPRLDEPERHIRDTREIAGVLDFLQRSQQILIVNTPLSGAVFHLRLSQLRHDSLQLLPKEVDSIWQSLASGQDLLFNALAPMGSVIWRVPIREKHEAFLVTAAPKIMSRLQSRRHHRVVGLSHRSHNASLVLNGLAIPEQTALSVEIDNLSEEGLAWTADAKQFAMIYERGQVIQNCSLELGSQSIRVPAIRIVHLSEAGPVRLRLGAQLHGLSEQDRRFLRRWLTEAEIKNASR
jgi:hypothetical protein